MAEKWMAEKWGAEKCGGERSPRTCSALEKQPRQERARPRAHRSDNRCYTGFDNANPTTERLPAVGGQEWPRPCPRVGGSNRGGQRGATQRYSCNQCNG